MVEKEIVVVWEFVLLFCEGNFYAEQSTYPLSELVYGLDMLALLHFVLSDSGYFKNAKLTIPSQFT